METTNTATDLSKEVDGGTAEVTIPETREIASQQPLPVIPSSMDFDNLEVADIELAGNYWTPQNEGESKDVIFNGVSIRENFDKETGDLTDSTLTASFFTKDETGSITQIANASSKLVGLFNDARFEPGMKFRITYKGKKNSNNGPYKYDDWSVKPLRAKTA